MTMRTRIALLVFVVVLLVVATAIVVQAGAPATVLPVGKAVTIKTPLGLRPVPIPSDNPPTRETIALGRRLYYDPMLSSDGTISCASCHAPQFAFADARPFSVGVGGKTGNRHSPTVINSAYNAYQFWDGRSPSLEDQAKGPIANPVETADLLDGVVNRLQNDSKYPELFKVWGTDHISIDMVAKSIASFERTVIAGNSPFDRYYFGHDKKAMSPAAQRGFRLFTDPEKGIARFVTPLGRQTRCLPTTSFTTSALEPTHAAISMTLAGTP